MMAMVPVTIREVDEDPVGNDPLDGVLELNSDGSDASSTNVTPEAQALAATKQLWEAEGIEVVAPSAAEMAAAASSMAMMTIGEKETSSVDVDDEKVVFEGYLRKRYSSSYYMGSWRYCVVHGNRMRWYMTEELARKDQQLRGEVFIKSVEPWNGHGSVNIYPHAFAIRTTSHRLLLCSAKSSSEKERWVQHLTRSVVSERQRRLSRRMVRNHHDGLTLSHGHGSDAAERRRIVPEDAVRAMAASEATSAYGTSINESFNGSTHTAMENRQHASSSVVSRSSGSEGSIAGHPSTECSRCAIRFGALIARRVICASCHQAFCSRHCNRYVRLEHTNTQGMKKCCMRCSRRQEFLVYLKSVLAFTSSLSKSLSGEGKSMMGLIQRPAPADPNQLAQEEHVYERTVERLRTAPMSLIKTIKILYQTRQKPHLFCVACERLPFYVENCIDRVESLWYQILHLFQCCDSEFKTFSMQLFCLQRYIAAICRRSPRIALQTIWHVQASMEDSSRHHPNSLLLLLGFLYPSGADNKIWTELLLGESPEHQRAAILSKLASIHEEAASIKTNGADSMIERWLRATSVGEFQLCSEELDRCGIQIIDFQSSIHYDSLKVAGAEEERSHLEEVVADQVRFVQSLAAISERLRHVQPVEDRSKYLGKELEDLNENLISSALYPLCVASDELYKVVRVPPTEGKVFSTKMRAPTLIFIEAVPVDAANLVGAERLLPFTSSRHRGSLTFIESVSALVDETTQPRDSLSSAESDITTLGMTPHHRRHGSQLSLPDSIDVMSNMADDDSSAPSSNTTTRQHQTKSLGSMLNNMSCPRDNNRSGSTHSAPNGGFSIGSLGAPTTPRITHARMDNIVYDSKVYGESWEERRERIRNDSPHGHLPGWQLFSIIVKTNDDLRQEMFTMQMMTKLKSIFEFEQLNLWLRTYRIVATGANIGLLETINDACSLDHLKKTFKGGNNLYEYFRATYGEPNSTSFEIARRNFIQSMAAYSIVSYVLLLKDRHNGNILLGAEGHIIHIDFGFILGIAPGGMFSIEDAPFKLTEEMVMIMGGLNSSGYAHFRQLMCDGFLVLQKYQSEIAALLQTTGQHSPFPCFEGAKLARVVSDLRGRLCVGLTKRQVEKRVDHLINKSYNAWGTRKYDSFQLRSNNIQP